MTRTLEGVTFDGLIYLELLDDPVVDALGHDPRSSYVERFWLPVLGPSTTWLLRLLTNRLEERPEGCYIDISEAARAIGLGERAGRHGPFLRSLARAVDFDMIREKGAQSISVRKRLPSLSPRHLARLPESLRREHLGLGTWTGTPSDLLRRRAQQLALSLLQLGEANDEAVRQLTRWKFRPDLAEECVNWARRELLTLPERSPEEPRHQGVVTTSA